MRCTDLPVSNGKETWWARRMKSDEYSQESEYQDHLVLNCQETMRASRMKEEECTLESKYKESADSKVLATKTLPPRSPAATMRLKRSEETSQSRPKRTRVMKEAVKSARVKSTKAIRRGARGHPASRSEQDGQTMDQAYQIKNLAYRIVDFAYQFVVAGDTNHLEGPPLEQRNSLSERGRAYRAYLLNSNLLVGVPSLS
jgi:hypothetical protein